MILTYKRLCPPLTGVSEINGCNRLQCAGTGNVMATVTAGFGLIGRIWRIGGAA